MAKSKSGGTRAYIRGRVGADVYSIGKTAKGKKQQVVRSLAETVANPQTTAQMRGRMIMSTIMQAVALMSSIIDHSFDNVTGRQPNISEFISRNYALIKADIAAHPSSGNKFGLNKYQEKGSKGGEYVISSGMIPTPAALANDLSAAGAKITIPADNFTMGGLKAALGMKGGDYITVVAIGLDVPFYYCRFKIKESIADSTAITTENVGTLFETEGNVSPMIVANTTNHWVSLGTSENAYTQGVIMSVQTANGWEHNDATMKGSGDYDYAANVALPTYPTGGADFLNGGDIFG